MREIRIRITTENDAFQTNPGGEIATILRELAAKAEYAGEEAEALDNLRLLDSNGNTVGVVKVS